MATAWTSDRRNASRTASNRSGAIAARSPPFVCASASAMRADASTPASKRTCGPTQARFAFEPPGTTSWAASARTPSRIGTAESRSLNATPEPSAISQAWPRRPKPVTSVSAWTAPLAASVSPALLLRAAMTRTARSTRPASATPRLMAVVTMPEPSGFVSRSWSPGRAPTLRSTLSGWTRPVTARPYLGSGSSMLWPPRMGAPASAAASAPPRRISPSTSIGSLPTGKPTRFSAKSGRAPIAQMSENALAAAMRPKTNGSSTTGVKKSTVSTMASVEDSRYTAASSRVSCPTRAHGSWVRGRRRRTCARSAGRILQAQPAPWDSVVSRTWSGPDMLVSYRPPVFGARSSRDEAGASSSSGEARSLRADEEPALEQRR